MSLHYYVPHLATALGVDLGEPCTGPSGQSDQGEAGSEEVGACRAGPHVAGRTNGVAQPRHERRFRVFDFILMEEMRTFSLSEAQTMLPILEGLLRGTMDSKRLIEEVDEE